MELTYSAWALLALAAVIIGVSKTGFPGVGILAVPLTAMVFQAKASTGLILPMLLLGDVMAVAFYRRHAVWKYLVKLLPCAVVGIVVGNYFLHKVNDQQLKPLIGVIILVLMGLNTWRNRRMAKAGDIHLPEGWWFPLIMGVLAGITTMMANAAGPIMLIYLLAMRLPKHAFIGTGAWCFLLLNAFKIPFSWDQGLITAESLWLNAMMAPVIIVSGLAGVWLARFVPEKSFAWMVQVLAALGAVQLVLSIWTAAPAAGAGPATAPATHSAPMPASAPASAAAPGAGVRG